MNFSTTFETLAKMNQAIEIASGITIEDITGPFAS